MYGAPMLDDAFLSTFRASLTQAHDKLTSRFPGDSVQRQPVSVLYGGAQLFSVQTPQKLGALARQALATYAPDAASFAAVFGFDAALGAQVYERATAKLNAEPVEDLRIDFEDGYGHRGDDEEDAHARAAGAAYAQATLPPFSGLRVKPLTPDTGLRALRTLTLFLEALREVPPGFVVTLPKVESVEQVTLFTDALAALEKARGWSEGTLRFELMVESPRAVLDFDGHAFLLKALRASKGRLRGVHFGAYDYTASLGIAAAAQSLHHPACDVPRTAMQLALAGTGVWLADGATTQLPVPIHRGAQLMEQQQSDNRKAVHSAWRAAAQDTTKSLFNGFYQGWDLHPAQLVSRYAALYAFFLTNLDDATARLRAFVSKLGQATINGTTFDDAATGQGLLNYFLRGLSCGALTEREALATGLSREEFTSRSFALIAARRREPGGAA